MPIRTKPRTGISLAAILLTATAPSAGAATYTVMHHFGGPGDGSSPAYQMVQDARGIIWGVTPNGGAKGGGTLWRFDPATAQYHVYLSFPLAPDPANPANRVPTNPEGLAFLGNGQLIGTTGAGGTARLGYIYTISRTNPASFKIQRSFDRATGNNNSGGLTVAADGTIWGPLAAGGPSGGGAIFSLSPSGKFAIRGAFSPSGVGGESAPIGGLAVDQSGNVWGATMLDGTGKPGGSLFMLPPGGTSLAHSLVIGYSTGYGPSGVSLTFTDTAKGQVAQPVISPDGSVFGTSTLVASVNCSFYPQCTSGTYPGAVYRRAPDGTTGLLHLFNGDDGAWPSASMVMDRGGALWGVTRTGNQTYDGGTGTWLTGTAGGTIFRLSNPAGATPSFEIVHTFAGGPDDGAHPDIGRLLLDRAGNIWGLARTDGKYGGGVLWRVTP